MSDQIATTVSKAGHGSTITTTVEVKETQPNWNRARSGPIALALFNSEAESIEDEINRAIDENPEEAVQSEIGQMILRAYRDVHGIREFADTNYPKFSDTDLITEGMCILAQLVAEEYFESSPETTPWTPAFFENWDFHKNRKHFNESSIDPFETYYRPDQAEEILLDGMKEWTQ